MSRKRFVLEARAAARLNHPNVVTVHEVAKCGEDYFIAMELVAGGNVAQQLETAGRLDWRDATRIVTDVCRGLKAAHAAGLIHRDIKPSNFMIGEDGAVKLADFGLSKVVDQRD